jgi:hypothetical protein
VHGVVPHQRLIGVAGLLASQTQQGSSRHIRIGSVGDCLLELLTGGHDGHPDQAGGSTSARCGQK